MASLEASHDPQLPKPVCFSLWCAFAITMAPRLPLPAHLSLQLWKTPWRRSASSLLGLEPRKGHAGAPGVLWASAA